MSKPKKTKAPKKAAVRSKPVAQNPLVADIIKLGGVLLALCAVVAMLLGVVNSITYEKIEMIEYEKTQAAMQAFAPGASFEAVEYSGADSKVLELYEIIDGGSKSGICVKLNSAGFDGDITMIVGVGLDQSILGVSVITHTETKGLGSKITDESWISQFTGLTGKLTVVKNVASAENEIVAITGATVSSTAVTNGVERAVSAALEHLN